MNKLLLLALVTSLLVLALPVSAEHTAEHVQQTTQNLMDAYLPPGYGSEQGIDGMPLYTLASLCQNYGGYWYDGQDGYYYWHDCAGMMH
jgi:hypothetical protein